MSAWECGEYIAEIVVIIGCVGEYLAEFTDRLTGGIETRKRRLSRLSLLILIIGLAVGLASLMGATITSGREIAALNVKASEANERSRKLELATVTLESDMKFRTALETLAQEDLRLKIAGAEREAATLRNKAAVLTKLAEDERLARVKIEHLAAPRILEKKDRKAIAKDLIPFAPMFIGHKIAVSSSPGDAEAYVFALVILDIFKQAGITSDPTNIGRSILVPPTIGLTITGPRRYDPFIRAFLNGIHTRLETKLDGYADDSKYTEVAIVVGAKSAGLPQLIPCEPWPACDAGPK